LLPAFEQYLYFYQADKEASSNGFSFRRDALAQQRQRAGGGRPSSCEEGTVRAATHRAELPAATTRPRGDAAGRVVAGKDRAENCQ
jgi:hypothetical protein